MAMVVVAVVVAAVDPGAAAAEVAEAEVAEGVAHGAASPVALRAVSDVFYFLTRNPIRRCHKIPNPIS